MRILIVNRHYGNPHVPTGRMMEDVVNELVAQEHSVTVLTSRSAYVGTSEVSSDESPARVVFLGTLGDRSRLLSWLLFLVQAWAAIPFMRWDRCILLTDPPFLAALSLLLHPFGGQANEMVWWTMDLYPEVLVSSGRLAQTSVLNRMLRAVNAGIVRRMGRFVLLGDCQLERMRQYPAWRDENYIIVPPWDNRELVRVEKAQNRFIAKYGLEGKKIALYAGNLGEGHVFEPIVQAARGLCELGRDDWAFVFVIRESKKELLSKAAQDLPNVYVLDYQPLELTADLLWSADVHLITMRDTAKGVVVPSKLYGVLKTDAPVLFIGPSDSDTAREIRKYDVGEALGQDCAGEEVWTTMDSLYGDSASGSARNHSIDDDGPKRIARFAAEPLA